MATPDGKDCTFHENVKSVGKPEIEVDDDDDSNEDDDTWDELDSQFESYLNCLFCNQNFKTMAVALEHCKTDHNFNLSSLKHKFNMDCYSYICMINYIRRENISPEILLSFNEPPWLNGEYLAPVIQDDPWLMFDFDDFESPINSGNMTPEQNYHVVNSENGLVTLTEQHFAQLQYKIKELSLQVHNRQEALAIATSQIEKMKAVTQNLVCSEPADDQEGEKTVLKMKLLGDSGYFGSYSHFGIHLEMLSDKVRTTKYRNAIMNNGSLLSGKVLLDVGCGTGILSMFAASAGAKKVYGIDKSDIIFNAMDIIRENNLLDKIDLIHAKVEESTLPVDKVDVIVSEWMGYFLLYEGMLESVLKARDRYLKPDGYLLPNRCVLYLIGISDTETYDNLLGFWSDVYGFKMSCLVKQVVQEAQIFHVQENAVATTASVILDLDLYKVNAECIDFSSDFCIEGTMDGHLTALCGYFDAFFDLANAEVLSTSPKSDKTHWKQTVFFLKNPIPITKGKLIKGHISCKRPAEDNRALTITITLPDQGKLDYYLM